ncbi:ABC transporter ATP-binding protein [Fulvimarina sp. MAC3]|uniref:ABC transporter ATP-binding protein n=1 Tax=Fulvimarina sp. MAC3 TaxID=3148887 RepID=UPI0031FD5C2C
MIAFEGVTKLYDGKAAVADLDLVAPTGKLTVLVGPSGCGKTTTLRMVNRLIKPTSGQITLDGEPTNAMNVSRLRRRIGYVIQHAGLFPHRTVAQNVAATARLAGISRGDARKQAMDLLEKVGLSVDLADRFPWQLSGGQQQRVGVARALAADPKFMLMDEPFSAVDPIVRAQLQDEFLRLQREMGKTIIMVTHDIDEALKLGDQVAVLREGGRLAQVASPQELLSRPADGFVADFVGRDRGYRRLDFAAMGEDLSLAREPVGSLGMAPDEAAAIALDDWLLVTDDDDRPIGWVRPKELRAPIRDGDLNLSATLATAGGTMRHLLDAALSSPSGRGVVVEETGSLRGTIALSDLVSHLGQGSVTTLSRASA